MSVRPSVRQHGPRFPLDEFSWNFIMGGCTKISREDSSLFKIRQNKRHCTCLPLLSRLPRLLWLLANLGIMVVMVTNVTIGFLVAVFTSGTIFANIPMVTFATMVSKVTSVHWLLGLRQYASNVPLCQHFLSCLHIHLTTNCYCFLVLKTKINISLTSNRIYFQLISTYINIVGFYMHQGQFNKNEQS
jgi:hypothetical protein